MKKLVVLTLPLLFLTGCSLPNNQPTEITAPTETAQIVSSTFDSSKIILE
jgi:uncharacterized protein YcfL